MELHRLHVKRYRIFERKCKGSLSLNEKKVRKVRLDFQATRILKSELRCEEGKAVNFFLIPLECLPTNGKEIISFSFSIFPTLSGVTLLLRKILVHLSKKCCGYWFLQKNITQEFYLIVKLRPVHSQIKNSKQQAKNKSCFILFGYKAIKVGV